LNKIEDEKFRADDNIFYNTQNETEQFNSFLVFGQKKSGRKKNDFNSSSYTKVRSPVIVKSNEISIERKRSRDKSGGTNPVSFCDFK